ncbi:MAG TPA: hypothetical protein VFK13_02555 [Gemmatimonadaceae bacterium]|nr:hypothetical protein [Gemmatimonadaceae bacterium]
MLRWIPAVPRAAGCAAALLVALAVVPAPAAAQYFGRNKVQYEHFDFEVLHTDHFDIHYYPVEQQTTEDAARMAERWETRLSSIFHHSLSARKPLIFYANQPDFQQTNVIGGLISEATGGVTEALRNRVVLPFTGSYADNDHVIGHELVHVFQYDIAENDDVGGLRAMNTLPLWLVEGMAEYLSLGRHSSLTAMWMRDAVLNNDFPTIDQLGRDPRYFPYRYGQALWAYVGGQWGDQAVANVYVASLKRGFPGAIASVLGVSVDTLSALWARATRDAYLADAQRRTAARAMGEPVVVGEKNEAEMNVGPALSPDGRYVAFFSSRGLFDVNLYLADAHTGKVIKKLASPTQDSHFDALSFINSAGSWSPDGRQFAFVAYVNGDNQIAIVDVAHGNIARRIAIPGVGAISTVAWSPDGQRLAVSGIRGGQSDLYVYDLSSNSTHRLTSDRYADLEPAWSPDGKTIAFITDRGEGTDFSALTYRPMRIALADATTGDVRVIPIFPDARHIDPHFSPDGRDLYFVADPDGYSDIYRVTLATGEVFRVTQVATGVSGITELSPAISVASQSGRVVFSVFDHEGYNLMGLDPDSLVGHPVPRDSTGLALGAILPPNPPTGTQVVSRYLASPALGLPSDTTFARTDYHPSLGLEYVGPPSIGVSTSSFGTFLSGGASVFFGDMLGNRTLGLALDANGELKDVGGQVVYLNTEHRWNWLVSAGRIPYLSGFQGVQQTEIPTSGGGSIPALIVFQELQHVFDNQVGFSTQYPFSTTRRLEFGAAYRHVGFDIELDSVVVLENGAIVDQGRRDLGGPPGLNLGETSVALVGDNAYFGFTSPTSGMRYRLEVSPTFGSINFTGVLADWRRYFFRNPFTFAIRGLHYGRYGGGADDPRLAPLFVGDPQLVRGYSQGSFDVSECTASATTSQSCPEFDRLIGSRVAVANFELRLPLFGTSQYGVFTTRILPVEIAPFVDAGLAWSAGDSPQLRFDRNTADRVPVVSAGIATRLNVFGIAIAEIFWAHPFQRPQKSGVWGLEIAPGW